MRLIYASRKDEGQTNRSGIEAETYGHGETNRYNRNQIITDKSHGDTNVKGKGHRVMDQIRKQIAEIDSVHREWGRDGQEPRGDNAECGKSHGLRGMSQHGLKCYGT